MKSKLRDLIQSEKILVAPGAVDALSAKLIEAAGFQAVYMTGFGTAATVYGIPDLGLVTMTEMVENGRRISNAVNIPVIADADTGYGNHFNAIRTVQEYEKAGVSGIHMEDQVFPKRCGHMDGHKLISMEDMVMKIRAAAASKKDKDFVLIIRTDAISAVGFEEAILRGNTYVDAGADVIFVEAPRTMDQLEKIPKLIKGPVLINMGPRTPNLHYKRFEEMGYAMIIYPILSLNASFLAIRKKLIKLKEEGLLEEWTEKEGLPFDELLTFLGVDKYKDLEKKLMGED